MKQELLGEALIKKGLITEDQLKVALQEQETTGELLGTILVRKKYLTEETMVLFLSCLLRIDYVDLSKVSVPKEIIESVPESLARRFTFIPLEKKENTLVVAMANPQNTFIIDAVRSALGVTLEPRITTTSQLNEAMNKYYGEKRRLKEIVTSVSDGALETSSGETAFDMKDAQENAPAIQLVHQLLVDAVKDRASDIHIEPQEETLAIRFRVDGVLYDIISPPKHMHDALVSRIKIMSNLDIAEKRIPQDGKILVKVEESDIDVRVSIYPTVHGEKAVLRILDRTSISFGLENLGFGKSSIQLFSSLISKPYGIILVTGPTGSGKTTTLYAALETIKTPDKNVVTIEDPVEYGLRGVTQSQINPKIGLTFATLLRSVMRQDPDVILVGEIRDLETAEVAIRAALTGHLVLSTLHTNDACGAVTRLIDMGIEPFLVASAVIGVAAQRLVRTICPKCKEKAKVPSEILRELGLGPDREFYHGKGCDWCHMSGYKGRTGVFEIMVVDDELREMITRRVSTLEISRAARRLGMRMLWEDALAKATEGVTTIEEAMRIASRE